MRFSDAQLAEYRAAVAGQGVIPLDDWSTLQVSGADRATFLHNMCTNDVRQLLADEAREAFFTDVKGKIVAHGVLLAAADRLLVALEPGQIDRLIPHLDRYIIREDVQLADQSDLVEWAIHTGGWSPDAQAARDGERHPGGPDAPAVEQPASPMAKK
ncbi:MAG TPA: hypothetical protein PJ982_07675, partial [Lacipirellulaceae bacterium]|nr:hypothetical protein [Lacipirellulaceae bacterium]